jgi:flagellar hook protein FlgE
VEGGAITVYSPNGAAVSVEMRWGKTNDAPDTWQLYSMENSDPQQWSAVAGAQFVFEDGVLQSPVTSTEPLRIDIPDLTVNGIEVGNVELNFGTGGLTQFDNANGRASVSTLNQDGYPAGSFMSVAINDSGRVVATYSNGKQIELYQLVTANFNAENQLKRLDGGIYASTAASGEAIYSTDGGVTGGALESSNTDISEEFTKLIVTQQAYAAGTRIVSTSDEMLQEALNMMR